MDSIPITALTTEELGNSHSVMDALPHLGGMLMVIVTLAILWGLTVLVSRAVALLPKKQAPAPAPVAPVMTPSLAIAAAPANDRIPPEIIAIISAAVAAVAGPDRRIISIRPMNTSWEKAGRQSVLSSHRIR
jgi:Na+-transporting methylmalonyl-CoA/oxaloacetate decarboxylase gamma subunit